MTRAGGVSKGVNPHILTVPSRTGTPPLLRMPVIGLGGASGGYLMWRLLSEMWI